MRSLMREDAGLSGQRTTALKGLFAIAVLLSHAVPVSGICGRGAVNAAFEALGYLGVALFFFASGYGLMAQYRARGNAYLEGFLQGRVLPLYLLQLFLIALYGTLLPLLGHRYSVGELLQSLLFGRTIVSNGWYLQAVLLFYVLFYVCYRRIRSEKWHFPALCFSILAYMLLASLFLYSRWYECSLAFLLGFAWNQYRPTLRALFFARWWRYLSVLFLTLLCFAAIFVLPDHAAAPLLLRVCRILVKCLSAPLFILAILPLMEGLRYEACPPLCALGKYSLDIYVLQGLSLHFFALPALSIENKTLYLLLSLLGTAVLALLLHPLTGWILRLPTKILQRGLQ